MFIYEYNDIIDTHEIRLQMYLHLIAPYFKLLENALWNCCVGFATLLLNS